MLNNILGYKESKKKAFKKCRKPLDLHEQQRVAGTLCTSKKTCLAAIVEKPATQKGKVIVGDMEGRKPLLKADKLHFQAAPKKQTL